MGYKLSVITPVFNGIRFIEFCIRNVIEQNCADTEHIIVDGGSTDGTVEIIKQYAAGYSHLRWVSEQDRGQSDAMNKGIGLATGNILGFLNADDYYEPDVLNWMLRRFAELPEPSLLVGNCNMWGDDGKLLGVNKPAQLQLCKLLTGEESVFPFPINPSAYFYHKSLHNLIGMYNNDDHFSMDIDFILRAVESTHTIYIDRPFGNFRHIEGTKTFQDILTGKADKRLNELIRTYRNKLGFKERIQLISFIVFARTFIRLKRASFYIHKLIVQ